MSPWLSVRARSCPLLLRKCETCLSYLILFSLTWGPLLRHRWKESFLPVRSGLEYFDRSKKCYSTARFANETRKPIVFDPVGVGATGFRKTSANSSSGSFDLENKHSQPSRYPQLVTSQCHQRQRRGVICARRFERGGFA